MLTKIDELNLPDHYYLDSADECYFIGEYTKGQGYDYSSTNQLIYNLKEGVDRRGLPEYRHKEQAMRVAAAELGRFLNPEFIRHGTFVPVPPSKAKDDALYDDRMSRIIRMLGAEVDLREVVEQIVSTPGAHLSQFRPSANALYANYRIAEDDKPAPTTIAVVDDVITAGAHFKAMKRILSETYVDVKIYGVFLARRVPGTE